MAVGLSEVTCGDHAILLSSIPLSVTQPGTDGCPWGVCKQGTTVHLPNEGVGLPPWLAKGSRGGEFWTPTLWWQWYHSTIQHDCRIVISRSEVLPSCCNISLCIFPTASVEVMEEENGHGQKVSYDLSKLIDFPGFNVGLPPHVKDVRVYGPPHHTTPHHTPPPTLDVLYGCIESDLRRHVEEFWTLCL